MSELINRINAEINWYLSLEKAEFLGVTAFLFCAAFLLCLIIWLLVKLIKSSQKPPLDITFKLEDAALEKNQKKSFVTFDLYVQNTGRRQIEISRVGFVMSDGSEKTFYQEPHVIKVPYLVVLAPLE